MNEVDIIVPVYNCEKFICEAINSILLQTWKDFQIIVVDDGSTDRSAALVKEMQQTDKRIKLIQPGKQGLSATLNTGIRNSKAAFVAFLDADDLWEQTKLEKQMKILLEQEKISACFTQIKEFETFENPDEVQTYRARDKALNGVAKLSFVGRRSLFEQFGLFADKTTTGDFVQWFSPIINAGSKYIIIPEVLAYRRIHDDNFTRNIKPTDYLRIIKAHLDAKKNNGKETSSQN